MNKPYRITLHESQGCGAGAASMIRLRPAPAGEGKNVKFKLYISFIKKSFINFLLKFCIDVCCHVEVCQKCDILTNNYLRYNFSTKNMIILLFTQKLVLHILGAGAG